MDHAPREHPEGVRRVELRARDAHLGVGVHDSDARLLRPRGRRQRLPRVQGRLGLEDRHVPRGLPREQKVRAGGRHPNTLPAARPPPPLPLPPPPLPPRPNPPPPRRYDVLKARKIVALQSGIMRVPGTAVAHCMPNYEQRREEEIGFKFVELEIYIDASARGRFNRPKITSDAVLLSSARSGRTWPDGVQECQTPLPGGVAPNALWMGVPLWEGVRRVHCRRTELPLRRRAARALRQSQPEERPRRPDVLGEAEGAGGHRRTCVCSSARTSPASGSMLDGPTMDDTNEDCRA